MFNFKKKDKNQPLQQPANMANNDALHDALKQVEVNDQPLTQYLTQITQQGSSLTLDLRLPHGVQPERIQQTVGRSLYTLGIDEVNLNVTLIKHASKPATTHMPKATNAMPSAISLSAKPSSIPASSQQSHTQINAAQVKVPPKQAEIAPHPRIKHIVVVASGKGGVGKSTTAVNAALALQKLGRQVGILDADIYGPSIPSMLGVAGVKPELENEQFVPVSAYGMPILSIGSLLDGENTPVAWRGPKATGALLQLFGQTNWPLLDYLIIDMPPGTGDIQLTLAQRIPVTGAVIVTTPQHIALLDAQKGIEMFAKTDIPVLGVVENMALHTCSNCGHSEAIFGQGGGAQVAEAYQVPLLGQLPLTQEIRAQVDAGIPSVIANEGKGDDFAPFYLDIAKNIDANITKFAKTRDDGRIF